MTNGHYLIPFGSSSWYIGLISFLFLSALVIFIGLKQKKENKEVQFRKILFWFFLLRELIFYGFIIANGKFSLQDSLPLHLCNISYIGLVIFLIFPDAILFEFLLLLGFGGALQSILTPELTHGYSNYLVIDYYLAHGAILFTPIYAYLVMEMKPRAYSWIKIWLYGHVILGLVGMINWCLSSNYIYLCQAPKVENPLVTGKFPYHLIGFEIFGTINILLFYFLFSYIFTRGYKDFFTKWNLFSFQKN